MKNKITCLLAGAALFGATANADIAIADGLTAYGYIDMSATDNEGAARTSTLAEYEIGLSFTPAESKWSAVAELSYDNDNSVASVSTVDDTALVPTVSTVTTSDRGAEFETVAVTYQYSDELSFSFGNLYTYMGLENADAPNNSFISFAGADSTMLYGATWAEGISADYSSGNITLGVWGEASANASFEYYAAYDGINNLTISAAVADNRGGVADVLNVMGVYELGDFTISAENVDSENTLDITSVSIAYNMGDTTIALRSVEGDYGAVNYEKASIAAFHALSDNVAAGIEYSDEELGPKETKGVSVELLYVF